MQYPSVKPEKLHVRFNQSSKMDSFPNRWNRYSISAPLPHLPRPSAIFSISHFHREVENNSKAYIPHWTPLPSSLPQHINQVTRIRHWCLKTSGNLFYPTLGMYIYIGVFISNQRWVNFCPKTSKSTTVKPIQLSEKC